MNNTKKEICRLRDRIDKIDLGLVKLLNKRADYAEKIGKQKLRLCIEAYSPEREKTVIRNVTTANLGPLSSKAIKCIFERIIDESRSVERIAIKKVKISKNKSL